MFGLFVLGFLVVFPEVELLFCVNFYYFFCFIYLFLFCFYIEKGFLDVGYSELVFVEFFFAFVPSLGVVEFTVVVCVCWVDV